MFQRKKIFLGLALFVMASFALAVFFYGNRSFNLDLVYWQILVAGYGRAGVLVYIALVAVGSAIGIPRQLFGIVGGYVFGLGNGLLWLSLGLVMGCALGFFASRKFFQKTLQQKFGQRLSRFEGFLQQDPFLMAVVVRFTPLGNNATTNIIAGLTTIPALPFITGSACGYLPQSLIFTLVGTGVAVDPVLHMSIAAVLLIAALGMAFFLYKTYLKSLSDNPCA